MNPDRYIPDIWLFDYAIAFFYLVIFFVIAVAYRGKKIDEGDDDYQYFLLALIAKISGGLGFLVLTVYYWGGGDTYSYWNTANDFTSLFFEDPLEGIRILFTAAKNMNWYEYEFAYNRHQFLRSRDTFSMVKVTAIINMLSFRSYVVCTVMFSAFSFLGIWNMYYVFCKLYPKLKKQLLYAFFFIPSVVLWGSGILKDTITLASIGWLIYSFMNIVLLKRKTTLSVFLIIISTLVIAILKPYILYILYPSLFVWVQSNIKNLITNNLFKQLIKPFLGLFLITSSYFLTQQLSVNAGRYNVDNLERTLDGFQTWHTTVSQKSHQSGYTLGEMEFSLQGMLKMAPAAINVTFFRPYLWEVRSASMLLAALEGVVLSIITLWLILKYRMRLLRIIIRNKDILFLVMFSLLFSVAVGISSYNFGALSRYKMPAQMFYVMALIMIWDKRNHKSFIS